MNQRGQPAASPIGWFWVWTSIGAGLATALGLAIARLVLHRFVHESPHLVWSAPLAFGILLAPIALIGWAARRWLGDRVDPFVLAGLVAVASYGILLNLHGIYPIALALIAIGAAVQVGRLFARRRDQSLRVIRAVSLALVALTLALTIGLLAHRQLRERRAIAALPPANRSYPNVLLLVLDTVRSFSLSVYGFPRPTTPSLEHLAATGAVFDAAFSTAPWTLPSHASIMTGTWANQNRASWTVPLDGRYPTLAEELSALGYLTGGFIANTQYTSAESGLERGFQHYSDWTVSLPMVLRSTMLGRRLLDHPRVLQWAGRYSYFDRRWSPSVVDAFRAWRNQHRDRPYFAFLNLYDAHAPYDPPAPFDSLFGAREKRLKGDLIMDGNWPEDEVARHRRAYEGSIAYQDHVLGELLAELERDGTLDSTLVIVTADHGEEFREHGPMGHGHSVYPATIRVPLLYRYPPKIAPRRIGTPISLRTIPNTVWDLLGHPGPSKLQGPSAARWLAGELSADSTALEPVLVEVDFAPNLRIEYPVSHGPLRTVIDSGFQLIENQARVRELYRLRNDPAKGPNLIDDPSFRSVAERLGFLVDSMTKAP